jgi:hypothetical protein
VLDGVYDFETSTVFSTFHNTLQEKRARSVTETQSGASNWYQQFLAYEEDIDYETKISELETRIAGYKHECVRKNAQTFLFNVKATADLIRVPAQCWVHLGAELFRAHVEHINSPKVALGSMVLSIFSKLSTKDKQEGKSDEIPEPTPWELLYKSWESKDGEAISASIKSLIISGLEQHPEMMDWLEQLFQLSLCSGWTAFEVLCEDLWEDLVNESKEAARNVCQGDVVKDDSKKLDLTLLFKYDFNLSNRMGTVLKGRYHFSSEKGIMTAFEDCLTYKPGKKRQTNRNELLYGVEQKRHLIQHSGGIIDEEYRKNMHSDLKVGDKLRLSAKDLDDALSEITNAGFALLDRTESWLENQTKIRTNKEKG